MADKHVWFKARRYGWGWTPATWQAWALLAGYAIILLLAAILLLPHDKGGSMDTLAMVIFLLLAMSATLILVGISMQKGEKPSWNWGDKKKGKKDD